MFDDENFLEYEQHLGKDLKRLYFEDKRYKTLRQLIKEQCNKPDGLVFAVRKDEIHIYYRGGRLLKITSTANGKELKIYTDPKYAGDEKDPNNEIVKLNGENTSENASVWCDNIEKLKGYVARYYKSPENEDGKSNEERLLQHNLELNNRDFNGEVVIIDNEYGVRKIAARLTHLDKSNKETFCKFTESELKILANHEPALTAADVEAMTDDELNKLRLEYKLCKVDLVALFKGNDGKYKICLTELKKGFGATGGKAGIKSHLQDFKIFTKARKEDIVKSVERLIGYKTDEKIDTIANFPVGGIELDKENIYISILCYDLETERRIKSVENKIAQAVDGESKKILRYFHYNLRLNKTHEYKLSKEDLLKSGIKAE